MNEPTNRDNQVIDGLTSRHTTSLRLKYDGAGNEFLAHSKAVNTRNPFRRGSRDVSPRFAHYNESDYKLDNPTIVSPEPTSSRYAKPDSSYRRPGKLRARLSCPHRHA